MSRLCIQVCRIKAVEKHPNADRLEIVTVKGWKVCVQLGKYQVGDKVVYFPPESIIPYALSDTIGCTNYLVDLPQAHEGYQKAGRIMAKNIRGVRSYGVLLLLPADNSWEEGLDVSRDFGVTKWVPPFKCQEKDAEPPHREFFEYTSIEHFGNYPEVFERGEEVIIHEKIHGRNIRAGLVKDTNQQGEAEYVWMAGSHSIRRKEMLAAEHKSPYWQLVDMPQVRFLIEKLHDGHKNVVVFGEQYGPQIQDTAYGVQHNESKCVIFDIMVDKEYLAYDVMQSLAKSFDVPMAPELFRGPYEEALIESYVNGKTTMCSKKMAGGFKGREGIVIRPVKERHSKTLKGRAILKSVSADFLQRKGATDHPS